MHGDEEATMETLSARRAVVDELIGRHRGRIANTAGDSILAEFASVLDAVHCAIEIQEALERVNDAGDVMVKDGDIFGDGVNVAARLEGLVRGGEICVSRGVHDHLRHRGGMVFEDLGEQLVKNIAHPIRAFRLRVGADTSDQDVSGRLEEIPGAPEGPTGPTTIAELSVESEVSLELPLWESVKDGNPAELESYLEQYSDGTFASLAKTRLDAAARSPADPTPADTAADTLDLTFWNSVKDSNRRGELQAYLDQHPNGHFAGLARARLSSSDLS